MKTDLTLYEIEPCHLTCGEWPSGTWRVTADGWWSPGVGGSGYSTTGELWPTKWVIASHSCRAGVGGCWWGGGWNQ